MSIIDKMVAKRVARALAEAEKKSAGFMEVEGSTYAGQAAETERTYDYADFIKAFESLPWLYAGAMALAIAAVKPTLKVYRSKGKDLAEVEGMDVNKVLARPNPFMSYRELLQITVVNMAICGEQFWNLVGTQASPNNGPVVISRTNHPVEIWWIKPEQIDVYPDPKEFIKKYVFTSRTGTPRDLDPSEIIHFRLPNPASYYRGLGAMQAGRNSSILELNAVAYNKNFLRNDATPNGNWISKTKPAKDQLDEFRKSAQARHGGPSKAGTVGVLWGEWDFKQSATSPKDAQYSEMRKMNREELLAVLPGSVPPSIVGLLEYANYSNMEVQSKKFWEDCVMPLLDVIADKLTLNLGPHFDDGLIFQFDYSNVRALQEDEERRSRVAQALIGCGLKTPNQLRKEMFNEDPYVGGDAYYMAMTLVPVGSDDKAAKARPAGGKAVPAPELKASFWRTPARKQVLWESFTKRLDAWGRAWTPAIEKYLKGQADGIRDQLAKHSDRAAIRAAKLFDLEAEIQRYHKEFRTRYIEVFKRAGAAGLTETHGKIYIPPEERILKADEEDQFTLREEHLARLDIQILTAAKFFNESTWKQVLKYLTQAEAEGWTAEELTQQLWAHLGDRVPWEARRIAETELARTENFGLMEGYKENGYVERKSWLCMKLPTSREGHIAADEKYSAEPIGMDEKFLVESPSGEWDEMDYPAEDSASAGNVCNCRCRSMPEVQTL